MSEEILTSEERGFALTREQAFKKYYAEVARNYAEAADKAAITGPAQRYVDENILSQDPVAQGRVDAYIGFLESLGRTQ
jgi:hypothetical protein